jgi:hypothetical protein
LLRVLALAEARNTVPISEAVPASERRQASAKINATFDGATHPSISTIS